MNFKSISVVGISKIRTVTSLSCISFSTEIISRLDFAPGGLIHEYIEYRQLVMLVINAAALHDHFSL